MKSNKLLTYICSISLFCSYSQAEILTISQAYDLALQNSKVIKSSQYQVEANKESIRQVRSEFYPQLNGSISHSKTEYEINNKLKTSYSDNNPEETVTNYTLSLSQSIYNPQTYGKLGIEKIRAKLYEVDMQIQKQELAKTVLKAYLDVLKSKNKITLLDSYAKLNSYKLEAIEKRFKMNLSNKMDLLQAKVEYNTSKLELQKEISLYDVYKLKLTNIIGIEDLKFPTLDASRLNNTTIQNIYSKVSNKDEFSSNLEVQQAIYAVEISKKDVKNSKYGHYPKVTFDATYTKYDSDDETTDYENTKKMMISLKLPIYQGGYTSSKVTASKLKQKAANEELNEMQNEIKSRYDELSAIFKTSVDSVSLYKETLESTKLYLESIQLGYQNGLKSIIDLHDAKNKLHEVKYKYIENMYDMMDSYIALLIVTNNFEELKLLDDILN